MDYSIIIKLIIMGVSFYYIRKLPIPDSYKFVLTIIPSLLLLSTNYVMKQIKYSGKDKPITVKREDDRSDRMTTEDFFYEPFTSFANGRNALFVSKENEFTSFANGRNALFVSKENEFTIELQKNANAKLHENESPYWIQSGGYLDISNPNNFIKIDNLSLSTNYTLEFWLRLKHISNNNIAKFYKDDILIFEIIYDDKFIYINQSTKIPITNDNWAHIVIVRGKTDTIGSDRGSIYINGIFFGYIDVLPNLQSMNTAYLFKNSNAPNEYNKNYHDLSNCALVRMYERSLTVDEVQNNYLKDAAYFGLLDEQTEDYRTYVNDKSLIFYLECRITTPPILDKTVDSSITANDVVEVISIPSKHKIKKSEPLYSIDDSKANVISIYSDDIVPNKPLENIHNISKPEKKTDQIIIIDSEDSEYTSNNWLQKAKQEHKKEHKKEQKQIKLKEEQIKLENNWLDGAPKPNNSKDKKDDKKDKKEVEEVEEDKDKDKKKDDKKKEKDDKKDVKEIKTSKPIF